jgi:hypothetical protein
MVILILVSPCAASWVEQAPVRRNCPGIMQDRSNRTSPTSARAYPDDKARGGEIILRRPWQRAVFMLGLAAPFVLLVVLLILQH